MAGAAPNDVALLLEASREGDRAALDQLVPLVYEELRRLAHHYMKRQNDRVALQTTAVVNEALARMLGAGALGWESRAHFLGIAAKAMRNVLVDYARQRSAAKRGGGREAVLFDEALAAMSESGVDVLALNEALQALAAVDERKARLVELRFFAGQPMEEAARALGISIATAERDWRLARAWLRRALDDRAP